MKRTVYCGAVGEGLMATRQTACGWVQTRRDMGGVIFVDLRDREGILQVVFETGTLAPEEFAIAETLKTESVIAVEGVVRLRDAETYNPKLPTGTVELKAEKLTLLSQADPLPFSLEENTRVREDLRLKYRFLDLRRPELYRNLKLRHQIQKWAEDYLDQEGFLAVETPMLTKSTPEGARDYLVPSRVHKGSFYALPQSPQTFKQLLMVGGIDKYYQVARCFRDEDLRADRQPEFTQVDMEMSFVEQEDILIHLEKMFKHLFYKVKGIRLTEAFPRLTWQEAMDRYGSDKPDLRFDMPIVDLSDIAARCSFSVFRKVSEQGGVVRGLNVKGGASFTRSVIEELTDKALHYGAKGMAWIAIREDGSLYSILTKYFAEEELTAIIERMEAKPGDFILFCADKLSTVRRTLGGLRLDIADLQGLRRKDDYQFLFVVDFPQFEYSEEEKRYVATHHPFTMPYPEDLPYLLSAPEKVRAQAYDVVLNGVELGSGSMRIYQREVQQRMFEALGFDQEQIEERFGFMVNAFRYGTPPHGGFAFGLDRFVMLMAGADSLREVIAFPKIKDASCPMTDAPTPVDRSQLEELGLTEGFGEEILSGEKGKTKKASLIDVEGVANLARLTFTPEESREMEREMEAIIGFANELGAIPTEGVPITAHVVPMKNVFREDQVIPSFDRERMLNNAPTRDETYLFVPRVVE